MKHLLLTSLLSIACFQKAWPQILTNLFPNPGFEQITACPEKFTTPYSPVPLTAWFSLTTGTPDVFSAGCGELVGVPDNWAGSSFSAEGDNYTGMFFDRGTYREYLSVKLLDTLQKDVEYNLFFFLKPASNSRYIMDSVTFAFTNEKPTAQHDSCISTVNYTTQQIENTGVQSPALWSYVDVKYKAKGDEVYFTIGNFLPSANVKQAPLHNGPSRNIMIGNSTYYFFDYFSISSFDHKQKEPVYPFDKFFSLPNVFFEFDRSVLGKKSKEELVELAGYLKNQQHLKLVIRGYADPKGSEEYNFKLSKARAIAVKNFLILQHVEESSLSIMAFGESDLKFSEDDKNRRVEFKLISD